MIYNIIIYFYTLILYFDYITSQDVVPTEEFAAEDSSILDALDAELTTVAAGEATEANIASIPCSAADSGALLEEIANLVPPPKAGLISKAKAPAKAPVQIPPSIKAGKVVKPPTLKVPSTLAKPKPPPKKKA